MKKFLPILLGLLGNNSFGAQNIYERCGRDNLDIPHSEGRIAWTRLVAELGRIKEHQQGGNAVSVSPEWIKKRSKSNMSHPQPALRRLMYPTFGVHVGNNSFDYPGNWIAPARVLDHTLWAWRAQQIEFEPKKPYVISAYCLASCYKPEMRILLDTGYLDIKTTMNLDKLSIKKNVMVLDEKTTIGNLTFKKSTIAGFDISLEDYNHDIIYLRMKSGTELRVTPNHTFLNEVGALYPVSEFHTDQKILSISGKPDSITSMELKKWKGKVLNLVPKGKTPQSQILAVEGYLTGSAYYQSVELTDLNRYVLRRNINL